jgi:hypothetical protein
MDVMANEAPGTEYQVTADETGIPPDEDIFGPSIAFAPNFGRAYANTVERVRAEMDG